MNKENNTMNILKMKNDQFSKNFMITKWKVVLQHCLKHLDMNAR